MRKTAVAVLAATGMVGQRYASMLSDHPYFELEVAGQRSLGKKFGDAVRTETSLLERVKSLKVKATEPGAISADLVSGMEREGLLAGATRKERKDGPWSFEEALPE